MHVGNLLMNIERDASIGLNVPKHSNFYHHSTTNHPTAVCSGDASLYIRNERMILHNQPSILSESKGITTDYSGCGVDL